jgi:CDP-diacylglycerol--serine O-phosphatidyltransferase
MISNIATFSWSSLRVRQQARLGLLVAVALIGAALFVAPWQTLSVVAVVYLAMIPFSLASYSRVRRVRASAAAAPVEAHGPPGALSEPPTAPAGRRRSGPSPPAR